MIDLWQKALRHRGLLFAAWFVGLSLAAIVLPAHMQILTVFQRVIIFAVGVLTLLFAVSLATYFIEAWKQSALVSNKREYTLWLGFETLIGVPFVIGCASLACMSLWVAVK
jgi:hypothetical protein